MSKKQKEKKIRCARIALTRNGPTVRHLRQHKHHEHLPKSSKPFFFFVGNWKLIKARSSNRTGTFRRWYRCMRAGSGGVRISFSVTCWFHLHCPEIEWERVCVSQHCPFGVRIVLSSWKMVILSSNLFVKNSWAVIIHAVCALATVPFVPLSHDIFKTSSICQKGIDRDCWIDRSIDGWISLSLKMTLSTDTANQRITSQNTIKRIRVERWNDQCSPHSNR